MSYAYSPAPGEWIEIGEAGTVLPGGGEFGEDVVVSQAFVESLPPLIRDDRGFVDVVETSPPEGERVIGWTVEDVGGVPTRILQTEPEV